MLTDSSYFVLAIGTDVGKTFFVENFCRKNSAYKAIKPIISGFRDDEKNSDSARILAALGYELSLFNLDEISPWRYSIPASPHVAAKEDGSKIIFEDLKKFCQNKLKKHSRLLIEGAGGVMTPIDNNKTFLDLAAQLNIPVLLISANYLGSISHTLCSIAALHLKNVSIAAVLVNEFSLQNNSSINISEFVETLRSHSGCRVEMMSKFLEKVS